MSTDPNNEIGNDLPFRAFLDETPAPVIVHERGVICYVNRAALDLGGAVKRADLVGMKIDDLLLSESGEMNASDLPFDAAFTRDAEAVGLRLKRVDGAEVDVSAQSVGFDRGEKAYACTFLTERTSRPRQLSAVEAERDTFQAVAENALAGNAIIQDGRFTYVNPRLADIFGYQVRELEGAPILTIIHPADHELVRENVRRRLSGEIDAIQYRARGRHANGSTVHVEVFGAASAIDGRPAIIGTLIDITSRVTMERERDRHIRILSRFSDRLRMLHRIATRTFDSLEQALAEYLSAGCTIFDMPAGTVKRIQGDAYEVIAGIGGDRQSTRGRRYPLEGSYCSRVVDTMQTVSFSHAGEDQQFAQHPVYHQTRVEAYIGAPIIIEEGVFGTLAFVSNSPLPRRFTQEDRELVELMAESLAKLIRLHRAEQLENEARASLRQRADELKIARDRSEEAARAKSEFMAKLSHEIRTPMNGIMGMADLLLESNLSSDQIHHLETIHSSGESLLRLVNDLLDFSKIEARKLELEETPFSIPTVVEEVTSLFALRAMKKGLRVASYVHPDVPSMSLGDPHRLRQALSNMLNNAVKFTDSGEIEIRVRPDSQGPPGMTNFNVRDTGIGIDPDVHDRIFDAFAQADTATTRRFGGTGLGLAITKQIAEMMGGTVTLESEPGRGATFTFQARFEEIQNAAHSASQSVDKLEETYILVVESSDAPRTTLTDQLRDWNIFVDEAADATTALQMIITAAESATPYDAALITRGLPGMDGANLSRAVAAIPSVRDLPMILLASVDDPILQDASHLPLAGTLALPVRREPLRNALLSLVTDRETGARPGALAGDKHRQNARFCRILVAEDDPVSQEVALGMLSALGYDADLVKTGRMAVEAAAARRYDLILLDVEMADLDGLAAAEGIRADGMPSEDAYIVAVTAHAAERDREASLLAGMDDHLAKPLNRTRLRDLISTAIARRETSDAESGVYAEASTGTAAVPDDSSPDVSGGVARLKRQLRSLRAELGETAFLEVMIVFVNSVPAYIADVRAALEEDDPVHTARSAHVLRGACMNMDLEPVSGLAERLERAAESGQLHEAASLLEEIETHWRLCRPVLNEAVRSQQGS